MRSPSLIGRADLLGLIATAKSHELKTFAEFAGYQPRPKSSSQAFKRTASFPDPQEQPFTPPHAKSTREAPTPEATQALTAHQTQFWHCVERQPVAVDAGDLVGPLWWTQARLITDRPRDELAARPMASAVSLLQWPSMLGFLRHYCTGWQRSSRLDEPRLIRELARGQPPARLPWRYQRRWPRALVLLQDRHQDLYPLRRDYDRLCKCLAALLGARLLVLVTGEATDPDRPLADLLANANITPEAAADARWLILSDLGATAAGEQRAQYWQRLVRELNHLELVNRPLVLLPLEAAHLMVDGLVASTVAGLALVPWDLNRPLRPAGTGTRPTAPPEVGDLLALLSMAVEAQPRLLRQLRLALNAAGRGGGITWELEAWNHPDVLRLLPECFLHPERRAALQECFANELPESLQSKALELIREDHRRAPAHVRDMERLWTVGLQQQEHENHDFLADAIFSLRHLPGPDRELLLHWAQVSLRGTRPALAAENRKLGALQTLLAREGKAVAALPDAEQLERFAFLFANEPPKDYTVVHQGPTLQLIPSSEAQQPPPAHRLTGLRSRSGLIVVSAETDIREAFWEGGLVAPWTVDWGEDEYGLWTDVEAFGHTQRLRWIPPGEFMMGSAEDEPERNDDEEPRHKVTFSEGFWLADTACTQTVWQAVLGENPSESYPGHFEHPVERVSWDDVQRFIGQLNERLPGLGARLPSEAEWEYACRSGTERPYAFGNKITRQQACFEASSTVPVRRYAPNDWGLYQMHGNVWEWCEDCWHENYQGAPRDGAFWLAADGGNCESRVVRGGSWHDPAGRLRSAYRHHRPRYFRLPYLGCRLSRGPEFRPSQAARASRLSTPAREVEPRAGRQSSSVRHRPASLLNLHAVEESRSDDAHDYRLPQAPQLLLRSDREELRLRSITRPEWASAMGRDRYGLFVDFKIKNVSQRLRWIEPGEFLMGSPEDELERSPYEGPRHRVILRTGFWLAETACSQALWLAVMDENPSHFQGGDYPEYLRHPVERVSWYAAQQFFERLNEKTPGLNARLPSEAQWEYACRACTKTRNAFGDEIRSGRAHFAQDWDEGATVLVKRFKPNGWGLYQMHGNVWEWCEDCWHESYRGAPADGAPWLEGDFGSREERVLRGGSWASPSKRLRSAYRHHRGYLHRDRRVGFRLCGGPGLRPTYSKLA